MHCVLQVILNLAHTVLLVQCCDCFLNTAEPVHVLLRTPRDSVLMGWSLVWSMCFCQAVFPLVCTTVICTLILVRYGHSLTPLHITQQSHVHQHQQESCHVHFSAPHTRFGTGSQHVCAVGPAFTPKCRPVIVSSLDRHHILSCWLQPAAGELCGLALVHLPHDTCTHPHAHSSTSIK
jgi:hypothetical protein